MVIYEKSVARTNTIKTRNESRDSLVKIGLPDPALDVLLSPCQIY